MGRLNGHEWEVEKHGLGFVMSHDHFSGLLKKSCVTLFAFVCTDDPHFREHIGRESSSVFFGHTLISSQIIANHVFAEVKIITYYQPVKRSFVLE